MISVMEDNCGTDFERITSRFSTPLSASSSGMVTWDSTSVEESPTERVWTSTRGGANSGKTSTGIFRTSRSPKNMRPAARKMRRNLKRRLQPTIERIIARYLRPVSLFELEFGAEQLGGADGHYRRTRRWAIGQDGHVTLYVI